MLHGGPDMESWMSKWDLMSLPSAFPQPYLARPNAESGPRCHHFEALPFLFPFIRIQPPLLSHPLSFSTYTFLSSCAGD
jgi:hypothetical protein